MKRCKHLNQYLNWGMPPTDGAWCRCMDCHEYISLGPASRARKDEVRLAKVIAYWMHRFPDLPADFLDRQVDGFAQGVAGYHGERDADSRPQAQPP